MGGSHSHFKSFNYQFRRRSWDGGTIGKRLKAISSVAGDINHCYFLFWSKPEYQQTLYDRQALLSDSISFGQRILIETQSILLLEEHHELGLNQPVFSDNVDGFIGV